MSKAAKPAVAGAGEGQPAKKGGKKKLLVIVLAILLLGGGAGGWFSGLIPKLLGHGEPAGKQEAGHGGADKPEDGKTEGGKPEGGKTEMASTQPVFLDLPDIIANLDAGPRRTIFVKLRAKLELAKVEDKAPLQAAMPRVLDLFQGFLREMRPEELRGSAATYRLREELMARTNLAAPPARVVAVLFTEMLVQ